MLFWPNMSIRRHFRLALALMLCCVLGPALTWAADEYVGSQFADGAVFSEVVVKDHFFAIPFPSVHGPLAGGYIESWLLRWNIADLRTNQPNSPQSVIYLARQKRTGEMAYGFRASASPDLLVCDSAGAVDLYSIASNRPARLLNTLVAPGRTAGVSGRLFSRSEKYVFLWKPFPAIYATSNFSVVKRINATENFKRFEADLRREGGWQESLTDDLKYLIYVPLDTSGPYAQDPIDTPHCYNLETDDYVTQKIRSGTNRTVIVAAESLQGAPAFIAFWQRRDADDAITQEDIDDVDLLANRLRHSSATDRVAQYVCGQLSPGTQRLLAAHTGASNPELKEALVADLERIIHQDRIYDRKRFAGVDLSDGDIDHPESVEGADLVALNRWLLRTAFSHEIYRSPYRHLGLFDTNSTLLAELPKQGTTDSQFWRNASWDYMHSRIVVRESGGKLTIYDYRAKQMQHFSLADVRLKVP
jgi:hypothetical protein